MRALLLALSASLVALPAASATPLVHASATCAPATKPGRIRCRAVLELPLERAAQSRIGWSEVRIVGGHPSVTPLRGRLGPLDAETRDDGRVVWSFSVAAAAPGELPMEVRLLATLESRQGGPPILTDQKLVVPVRVIPEPKP